MKKICVVTGSRAEYGLLSGLLKKISSDPDLILQIIATGMHLSPEFGLTFKKIEEDGFKVNKKIEMLLSSDTPIGITKSIGLGLISLAEAFEDLRPDVLVILGDRFEALAAAIAGMIGRIPIAHLHGGEKTEGAFDEAIRHSITKMSHLHFTAAEEYKSRVIQLGEHPSTVHNVGALGVENIKKLPLLSKKELEKEIRFELGQKYLLVTFHPVTLEQNTAEKQINSLLSSLTELTHSSEAVKIIFTKANADTDSRIINQLIDNFVTCNPKNAIAFDSMGKLRYLSAMKYSSAVIGNSSSGIIEAPSFKIPTINIGERQKGRLRAKSIIDCMPDKENINKAIQMALSDDFNLLLKDVINPYEKQDTSKMILEILKKADFGKLMKKAFFDFGPNF